MNTIYRLLLLLLLTLCPCTVWATGAEYPRDVLLRRVMSDGSERLCTPVARYTDSTGRIVDLVGAIHLAEPGYYRNLNRAFARYDKVLFEMVDGEGMPEMLRLTRKVSDGTATREEMDDYRRRMQELAAKDQGASGELLARYYSFMCRALDLQLQVECIDYSAENFIFADMSSEQFARALKERGESWTMLIIAALREDRPSLAPIARDRTDLRRTVIRSLAAEGSGHAWENSAILISRNEACFAVLDRELAAAPTGSRIAIFYGAMHLRDMHRRMLARGFVLQGVQWLTAIRAR